jgi:hypothetical protein
MSFNVDFNLGPGRKSAVTAGGGTGGASGRGARYYPDAVELGTPAAVEPGTPSQATPTMHAEAVMKKLSSAEALVNLRGILETTRPSKRNVKMLLHSVCEEVERLVAASKVPPKGFVRTQSSPFTKLDQLNSELLQTYRALIATSNPLTKKERAQIVSALSRVGIKVADPASVQDEGCAKTAESDMEMADNEDHDEEDDEMPDVEMPPADDAPMLAQCANRVIVKRSAEPRVLGGLPTSRTRSAVEWKSELLKHLQSHTHAQLTDSLLGGVGVQAIRKIPKNTEIFRLNVCRHIDNRDARVDVELTAEEVGRLPKKVAGLLRRLIVPNVVDGTTTYPVPVQGLNGLDPSFFCNATLLQDQANVEVIHVKDQRGLAAIRSTRDIIAGEELLLLATSDPSRFGGAAYANPGDAPRSEIEALTIELSSLGRCERQLIRKKNCLAARRKAVVERIKKLMPPPQLSDKVKQEAVKYNAPAAGGGDVGKSCWAWFAEDNEAVQATLHKYFPAEKRRRLARRAKPMGSATAALANATRGCYLMRFGPDGGTIREDFDYVSDDDKTVDVWDDGHASGVEERGSVKLEVS